MKPVFTAWDNAEMVKELYEWLREKDLTTAQAIRLLNRTESVIRDARTVEASNLKLQPISLNSFSKLSKAKRYAFAK